MVKVASIVAGSALLLAGCVSTGAPLEGGRYVAMGSSFAAGPGVTTPAETAENRCQRSSDNYAHQLARRRNLTLTDVSCGGATTAHIVGPWNELPAQVDALTADTALVTLTIGGNDVGYIGGLMAGSCRRADPAGETAAAQMCRGLRAMSRTAASGTGPSVVAAPGEEAWRKLADGLDRIVAEVRRRAPQARLVFVDYPQILAAGASCERAPLDPEAAATARATAARLAQVTADAARRGGAELVSVAQLSRGHDACSGEPWVTGFVPAGPPEPGERRFAPYHPNLRGMSAAAEALDVALFRRR